MLSEAKHLVFRDFPVASLSQNDRKGKRIHSLALFRKASFNKKAAGASQAVQAQAKACGYQM
jgi:hypothetical protein